MTDQLDRSGDVALAGTDRPQLDGTVAPGESRRGWMAFEVGDDATDLRLRLRGSATAAGAVFDLG